MEPPAVAIVSGWFTARPMRGGVPVGACWQVSVRFCQHCKNVPCNPAYFTLRSTRWLRDLIRF